MHSRAGKLNRIIWFLFSDIYADFKRNGGTDKGRKLYKRYYSYYRYQNYISAMSMLTN